MTALIPAPAPTKPFVLTQMKSFTYVADLPNYDIEVEEVHEFFANKIHNKNCIGNYHPHGDMSIYGGLVTLANMPESLVHKSGNWGSMTDPKPAAFRYTECKISKLAEQVMFDNYNMAIVEEIPNFDGQNTEPLIFVPNLPLVLLYGITAGIAVGVTTEIPCFTSASLGKIVRAAMGRTLRNKQFTPITANDCAHLLEFRYKFGGYVTNSMDELREFFGSPGGRLNWSCEAEWSADGRTCSITGFPPQWGYSGKLDKFEAMPEVMQVAPTNKPGGGNELRIILKKASAGELESAQAKVNKMLTSSHTYRINLIERYSALDDGLVVSKARFFTCSIPELLNMWIKWRVGQHKRALEADRARLLVRLAREELVRRALDFLDQMVEMLKNRTKGFDKVKALAELMGATEDQAGEIWQIAIGRFDRLSITEQDRKIADLNTKVEAVEAKIRAPFRSTYAYLTAALA